MIDAFYMQHRRLYILCDILQFNIINTIFVTHSNQFYSLGGGWCKKFKMMTLYPHPGPFDPKINML